ncbi:hypothetical protein ACTAQI_07490 [Pseudarthrobacter sp. alpha12b]
MSVSVMLVELQSLERSAETLEKIVYSHLTALEGLPEEQTAHYEARVLRKLQALDELQERIDGTIAKLKEAGGYRPSSRTAKSYFEEHMQPKRPLRTGRTGSTRPKAKRTPSGPPKFVSERGSHSTRLIRSRYWQGAEDIMDSGDGTFTIKGLMAYNDQTELSVRSNLKKWRDAGLITGTRGTRGHPAVYSRA